MQEALDKDLKIAFVRKQLFIWSQTHQIFQYLSFSALTTIFSYSKVTPQALKPEPVYL